MNDLVDGLILVFDTPFRHWIIAIAAFLILPRFVFTPIRARGDEQ